MTHNRANQARNIAPFAHPVVTARHVPHLLRLGAIIEDATSMPRKLAESTQNGRLIWRGAIEFEDLLAVRRLALQESRRRSVVQLSLAIALDRMKVTPHAPYHFS